VVFSSLIPHFTSAN